MGVGGHGGACTDDAAAAAGVVEEAHADGEALGGGELDGNADQRLLGGEAILVIVGVASDRALCVGFGGWAETGELPGADEVGP